jgi:hypothetical protein
MLVPILRGITVATTPAGGQLTVQGFTLSYDPSKGWKVGADSLTVGGLSLPTGSWGWIGLSLAQGVLSGIGGMIFSAVASALLGKQEPDIAALLKQQLVEFARIVKEAFDANDLKHAQNQLAADADLVIEYCNARNGAGGRLEFLVPRTAETLRELESLGYMGYRAYIQLASIRLALLQDISLREGEGAKQNFLTQLDRSTKYHETMIEYIKHQTEPSTYFPRVVSFSEAEFRPLSTLTVLGRTFQGRQQYNWPPNVDRTSSGPPDCPLATVEQSSIVYQQGHTEFIDWLQLRAQYMAESTDIGSVIVNQWKASKPGLMPKAAKNLKARLP